MAKNKQTFRMIADFGNSHYLENNGVNVPAEYEAKLPDLWQSNSLELYVECWEDYLAASGTRCDFGSGATTTLKIKRANSTNAPTTLVTGTVETESGASAYNVLHYQLDADTIPTALSSYKALMFGVTENSPNERTWATEVNIIDDDGNAGKTIFSKDLAVSTTKISTDTTASAVDGFQTYILDANCTLELPPTSGIANQELRVITTSAVSSAFVSGAPINGSSGAVNLNGEEALHLLAVSGTWYNCNFDLVIK